MKLIRYHDVILNLLVEHLQTSSVCLPNVPIGASWSMSGGSRGKVDVLAIKKCYREPDITIYEVKGSKNDLMQDIRSEKFRKYYPHCNRLVFAYPYGMVSDDVIPSDCGIITWNKDKKSWHTKRRGVSKKPDIDIEMMLSVLMSVDARYTKRAERLDREQAVFKRMLSKFMKLTGLKTVVGRDLEDSIGGLKYEIEEMCCLQAGLKAYKKEKRDRGYGQI